MSTLRSVALALLGSLLWACGPRPYELARPWAGNPQTPLESARFGEVTRPAFRFVATPGRVRDLPLGPVLPGLLETHVALRSPEPGEAVVQLALASDEPGAPSAACRASWSEASSDRTWRECTIPVAKASDHAFLELRLSAPTEVEVYVASPMLTGPAVSKKPSVFLFLVSGLRPDRLKTFNPEMPLGLALERLAADGVVFEEARSSSSLTRPALASLFTGLWPASHRTQGRDDVLKDAYETLPEVFQRAGYRTLGWSASPDSLPMWGFGQGFDEFVEVGALAWATDKTDARKLLEIVGESAKRHAGKPVLYFCHLMDPHPPYRADDAELERLRAAPGLSSSFPGGGAEPPRAEVVQEYERYIGEISGVDDALGAFLDELGEERTRASAILLTSDHGQEFLDHGGLLHGRTLHDEMLRVPLLLKLPGNRSAGVRIAERSSLADVAPTLLRALGLSVPVGVEGRTIPLDGRRGSSESAPPQFAVLKTPRARSFAVVDGSWKLIADQTGAARLYDLEKDPRETKDLGESHADRASILRFLLDRHFLEREEGWHVRGCGARDAVELRFEVRGAPSGRPVGFEADDLLTEISAGEPSLDVTMNLRLPWVRREVFGQLRRVRVTDEDEIAIPPRGEAPLEIRSLDDREIAYSLGRQAGRTRSVAIPLDPRMEDLRVPSTAQVACWRLPGKAPKGSAAYVRIWYVGPSETLDEKSLEPADAERLRALGYL